MFKKLVSNIPFNPSLIERIPDYRASLKRELNLRLLGIGLLALAFLGQLFITIYPAQPTLASSPNDLLTGGFSSQAELTSYCNSNVQGYRTILSYYSISCNDLSQTKTATINVNSYNKQLYSLNRLAYGQTPETAVQIKGQKYWLRPLSKGSSLASVKLQTLTGVNSDGIKFFILNNSGDMAFIGQPLYGSTCSQTHNCPNLSISARNSQSDNVNNATAKPGSVIIYTLLVHNPYQYTIHNFVTADNFSSALTYSKPLNLYGATINNGYVTWPKANISSGQAITRSISFTVSNPTARTPLSSSDSNYYNMKMATTYGNTITVKVPWSFSKYFELKINNSSPSLSAISSLIVSAVLILCMGFFVRRNKLLLKEIHYIKQDYLDGGKD